MTELITSLGNITNIEFTIYIILFLLVIGIIYIIFKKPLWEQSWFIQMIGFCRKCNWFDKYIYGKSVNLEDFVRNPAEVLRDECAPFVIKDIKPYSVINLRLGYVPYDKDISIVNCWSVPMGDKKWIWKGKKYNIIDVRAFNPWYTKFCNSMFFFQFAVSLWNYIPIPYISLNFRLGEYKYFQFGLGYGPQLNDNKGYNTVLCGKLRYVNQLTSNENIWNPTDIIGYYEGTI